jgi:hypothetical protein
MIADWLKIVTSLPEEELLSNVQLLSSPSQIADAATSILRRIAIVKAAAKHIMASNSQPCLACAGGSTHPDQL